jgi:MFS family permease
MTRRPLWPAFSCESFSSVGTTLLQVGIFFYTQHYFGWGMKENFLLAASQGVVYVAGSLTAAKLASHAGRRGSLIVIYAAMAIVALAALVARSNPLMLAVVTLGYVFVSSLNWPLVESLVTAGSDAHAMSRRVGIYNLVWSGTNAVVFAISGSIIQHWQAGMFLVPAMTHATSALLMLIHRDIEPPDLGSEHGHVEPEPELLAKRKLAMWLARISLPATYVVVYSLMAMMPSLPVMKELTPAIATLVGSTWMLARFAMFILLGATTWWHTRPMLLLASSVGMLAAFIGVTLFGLAGMIAWQIVLGAVMGVIYSGSLYFGMVLSQGSAEHGGYHEALIGLGSIIGPGVAALTQYQWPGNLRAGVVAVSCVIATTVAAATVAAARASKQRPTT